MRSLSRREKMSQPRSPRWVCSMTVGMMKLPNRRRARFELAHGWIPFSAFGLGGAFAARACSGVTISEGSASPSVIFACAMSMSRVFCSRIWASSW